MQPTTHERLVSEDEKKSSSDRVFAAVFAIVGLWPLTGGGPLRIRALGVAAPFLAAAALHPKLLAPVKQPIALAT